MVIKMKNSIPIKGIHHITAICSNPEVNLNFYEKVLGLKLVKQTVNFDDPYTYHLYYGDEGGTPGTILTFFPWEEIPQGKIGTGAVSSIGFAIPAGSTNYWYDRLTSHELEVTRQQRFGDVVIQFKDPDGLQLELVASKTIDVLSDTSINGAGREHRIRGFHSATSMVSSLDPTKSMLQDVLGMELIDMERDRYRFKMATESLNDRFRNGLFYDLVVNPELEPARQGSGTVHHIAFRAINDEEQAYWQKTLHREGIGVTAVKDRKYFRSVYFHEPGGVLFEIATDGPGFNIDEPSDSLGQSLMLPPQYESMRATIKDRLPTLRRVDFTYRFENAEKGSSKDFTIVVLHGTGGDENDLIPLAERVAVGTAILSPRGKVKERGMNRFFKRLAPGLFDEKDLVARSEELANFVKSASKRYDRRLDKLVALGYSNGANIAAANLLLQPELYEGAILLRPMLPLAYPKSVDLSGKEILILKGANDPIIPAESTEKLIRVLKNSGAQVEVHEIAAAHEIAQDDIDIARSWYANHTKAESVH